MNKQQFDDSKYNALKQFMLGVIPESFDDSLCYKLLYKNCLNGLHDKMCNLELLWTNPEPSRAFNPQTITLPKEYSLLIVEFLSIASSSPTAFKVVTIISNHSELVVNSIGTEDINCRYRSVTVDGNNVTFDDAYNIIYQGTEKRDDKLCVPYKIYGIN